MATTTREGTAEQRNSNPSPKLNGRLKIMSLIRKVTNKREAIKLKNSLVKISPWWQTLMPNQKAWS